MVKLIKNGVTFPKGFKTNGIHCGIKRSGKLDLSLIYSETLANCAAAFTKNSVKAAPLIISQKHIKDGKAQAILTNSGNANCFTGKFGLAYAKQMAIECGELLNIARKDVVVMSTGIIGKPLPIHHICEGLPKLVKGLSTKARKKAAEAILTTDLVTKEIATEIILSDGKAVRLGGVAKGSGMIAPNMATMLAYITTDVAISNDLLKKALQLANDVTFNCISVDGCMSTNDTVVVLANGYAKNKIIKNENKDFILFVEALTSVCMDLAKKIVLDGEGATKFMVINVSGAKSKKQAKKVANQIANSNLVKTAAYASDPNWGRVIGAVGAVGDSSIKEDRLKLEFSSFKKKNIAINVDLNIGIETATVYTCDLSNEYVRINGEYN